MVLFFVSSVRFTDVPLLATHDHGLEHVDLQVSNIIGPIANSRYGDPISMLFAVKYTGTRGSLSTVDYVVRIGVPSGWIINPQDGYHQCFAVANRIECSAGNLSNNFGSSIGVSFIKGTDTGCNVDRQFTVSILPPDRNPPPYQDYVTSNNSLTYTTSVHCNSLCGNGLLETPGEACDDGNLYDRDGCSASCQLEEGFTCQGGHPTYCSPTCGDGRVRGREPCDDGNLRNGDGCSTSCGLEDGFSCTGEPSRCVVCGNGLIEGSETCDDRNRINNDGCSSRCSQEHGYACTGTPSSCQSSCGDGAIARGAEDCDDRNTVAGDGCSATCQIEPNYSCESEPSSCNRCGDGRVGGQEYCDDGNPFSGDGCSSMCHQEQDFWCTGTAPSVCVRNRCGDYKRAMSEGCDDGNLAAGDGCSETCAVEQDWACHRPEGGHSDCGVEYFAIRASATSELYPASNATGTPNCTTCPCNPGTMWISNPTIGTPASHISEIYFTFPRSIQPIGFQVYGTAIAQKLRRITFEPNAGSLAIDQLANFCSGNGTGPFTQTFQKMPQGVTSTTLAVQTLGAGGIDAFALIGRPAPFCGNGFIDPEETCDDGNTTDGDGCSSTCRVENGFSCTGRPSVCSVTCGDRIVAGQEACDDGNTNDTDGCLTTCRLSECKDGVDNADPEDTLIDSEDPGCHGDSDPHSAGSYTPNDNTEHNAITNLRVQLRTNPSSVTVAKGGNLTYIATVTNAGPDTAENVRVSLLLQPGMGIGYVLSNPPDACTGGNANSAICVIENFPANTTVTFTILANVFWGAAECPNPPTIRTQARVVADTYDPLMEDNLTPVVSNPISCPRCGDGMILQGVEQCDDRNINSGDGCSAICQVEEGFNCPGVPGPCSPACGDGRIRGNEQCDQYFNSANGDGCSATCHVETGWTCSGEPSVCTRNPFCGDGVTNANESCDDRNTASGDGCTSACQNESGWTCSGQPSSCTRTERCGDGIEQSGEQCDDGNTINVDECTNGCMTPRCGDAILQTQRGEQCDDGNSNDNDLCSNSCRAPVCGDGKAQGNEQCDDGNSVETDECHNNCTASVGATDADVEITVSASPTALTTGPFNITYTVTVRNKGPATARRVIVSAPAATGLSPNSAQGIGCNQVAAALVCLPFDLAPNESRTGTWLYSASPITCGPDLRLRVNELSDNNDPNAGNNTAVAVTIAPCPGGICGDRIRQTARGEQCDDGNAANGDGCSSSCFLEGGFICNAANPTVCTRIPVCGDGLVVSPEVCDDGNRTSGDGCSPSCNIETGWTCTGQPSVCSRGEPSCNVSLRAYLPTEALYPAVAANPSSGKVYVFGGLRNYNTYSSAIYEYDPATNTVAVAGSLPLPLYAASAVWSTVNNRFYLFGGITTGNVTTSNIIEYNPITRLAVILSNSRLPFSQSYTAAFWSGTKAYILMGNTGTDRITEFDPSRIPQGTAVTMRSETLPTGRKFGIVASNGNQAFIMGGVSAANTFVPEILRYDPGSGNPPEVVGRMSTRRTAFSAFRNASKVYLFGGYTYVPTGDILQFGGAGSVVLREERLNPARIGSAAVWNGRRGFIVGGENNGIGGRLRDIVEYSCN